MLLVHQSYLQVSSTKPTLTRRVLSRGDWRRPRWERWFPGGDVDYFLLKQFCNFLTFDGYFKADSHFQAFLIKVGNLHWQVKRCFVTVGLHFQSLCDHCGNFAQLLRLNFLLLMNVLSTLAELVIDCPQCFILPCVQINSFPYTRATTLQRNRCEISGKCR